MIKNINIKGTLKANQFLSLQDGFYNLVEPMPFFLENSLLGALKGLIQIKRENDVLIIHTDNEVISVNDLKQDGEEINITSTDPTDN